MKTLMIKTQNLWRTLGLTRLRSIFHLNFWLLFPSAVLRVQIFQLGLMIAFSATLGVFIIYLCVFMDVQVQLVQVYVSTECMHCKKNQTVFNLALIYVYITVGLISDCFLVLYRSLLDSYIDIKINKNSNERNTFQKPQTRQTRCVIENW